jgi:hypothetical protein
MKDLTLTSVKFYLVTFGPLFEFIEIIFHLNSLIHYIIYQPQHPINELISSILYP